jgi:tetraacyldisaccharide 4'-kinase
VVAYDRGILSTRWLGRPVISVGNLTYGGTGKTPLVAALTAFLRDEGLRVVILTRGYGRKRTGREVLRSQTGELPPDAYERGGDEPALLARELPGVTVVVDADRYAAASWAERALDPDVFVLDDGFQHLRLGRDLDILVVDATDPFGGAELLPLGRLREPTSAIKRADAIVVTRADRPFDRGAVERVLREHAREDVPVLYMDHELVEIRPLRSGASLVPSNLRGYPVGVITAIGNPRVLLDDLHRAALTVVSESIWPDHHDFSQPELDDAVRKAHAEGASVILTTEKDAIKLERLATEDHRIYVVRIGIRADDLADLQRLSRDIAARGRKRT